MKDNVLAEYAYYFFLSRYKIFEANSSKTTLPIINQKGLGNLDFVCPDFKIQEEIVRFLNYYKECLDNNSYPVNDGFNLDNKILDFALRAFKASIIQQSLINENKTQSNLLSKLRQAYLQEAVMGKLTEPSQDDAKILLADIKSQKAQLIKEGKLRKEKPLPPIKPEEIPFEIPDNWVWCRLGDLAYITSGSTPSSDSFVDNGIPYLKMYNLRNQKIDFDFKPQFIKEEVHNGQLKRCRAYSGDILMNIVGPPLGKIAIIPDSIPECNFNQAAVLIRPIFNVMNYYIYWFLNEMSQINDIDTKGVAGQDNISVTQAHSIKVALPPLSEQKAIVEKVEGLLANVSLLEEENKIQQNEVQRLMGAVLQEAFGGR